MSEATNGASGWPQTPPMPKKQRWLDRLLGWPWPPVDVLVLKSATCPLCDEVLEDLEDLAPRLGMRVRAHLIDADPALAERFRNDVPVTVIDGKPRFRGRIDRVMLWREVQSARSRSASHP